MFHDAEILGPFCVIAPGNDPCPPTLDDLNEKIQVPAMFIGAGDVVPDEDGVVEVGPAPTAPHAISPATATINKPNNSCGVRRCTRLPDAESKSPARPKITPTTRSVGKRGSDSYGNRIADAAACGVVVIESVTVCGEAPNVIGPDGTKEAASPAGSGVDRPSVTGSENVPREGETVNANVAVCPAVMGGDDLDGATV